MHDIAKNKCNLETKHHLQGLSEFKVDKFF
jgi:hypothetical protein